jgi:predicted Zn-dependent peptidase
MPFHHTVLPNGLQVVAELNDRARSVASGFFVKTGSRDESPEVAGVSHFLEHMVFKGTPRRDAIAVNRDFDRVGAKHNAQTSEEDTVYHVTSLPEYLPRAFDVLTDILRPSLRAEDFETEKQVILEEIRMYLDNPMSVAYEAAKAEHFGGHPLGQSILGTVESITDLGVDRMREYFARRYSPANIVLAFAGKSDWGRLVELAQERCGGWEGAPASREAVPAKGSGKFKALLRADDNQQTVIGVADAPPLESPDRYAAQLLSTILGDHTGSRLYWSLIDPGHADGVEVSYQDYNQAGTFYTFLSCEPEESQANLGRIAEVFRRMMADGPTEAELTQAKNKVLARTVLRGERPMGRLMSLGFHWTYRREYLAVERELEAYNNVQIPDLRRVLEQWPLLPMTTVSVGPTTDVKPVE